MSDYPWLKEPIPDEEADGWADDKHGFNNVDRRGSGSGSTALKEFLANPDISLAEARKAGIPKRQLDDLQDQADDEQAKLFLKARPQYHRIDDNYKAILEFLDSHGMAMTCANLVTAFDSLTAEGQMVPRPGEPKELSAADKTYLARVAATGDVITAIELYLDRAFDEKIEDEELMSNPKYRKVCDQAVLFCWSHGNHKFNRNRDQEFIRLVDSQSKPLNVALLNSMWEDYVKARDSAPANEAMARLRANADGRAIPENVEDLSDAEVARAYQNYRKNYRNSRR